MPQRLLILVLALACFSARFHCALAESGWLTSCCDEHTHHESSEEPGCEGCPDLESNSTATVRKVEAPDAQAILLHLLATRPFTDLLRIVPPAPAPVFQPPPSRRTCWTGSQHALASHLLSQRGPPARA